ncbi:MAG: M20/M25/M40 family metallo-hydrolase [Desulfobacterales bacterium]|nr:M20/M25/M40 family metallo-hydrolase [Desulfobacterales bacterium]
MQDEIRGILKPYMAAQSDTGTAREREAELFLKTWFEDQAYFQEHPDHWGLEPVKDDALDRHVVWGMVRGTGPDTVVLVHHYDVVDAGDFGAARHAAHDLDRVHGALETMIHQFDEDARLDYGNPDWIFGRGGADMKAGGAIQMALLKAFSREASFKGNLILCCLPDEENMSAGMRSAVPLLARLQEKYQLKFRLMIDSEPHERGDENTGTIYEGSVGKVMPIVLARGRLAHTGRIFEGLNPLHLVSEFMVRTELNMDFSEAHGDEALPPPSWLHFRDGKTAYDVSIPATARAYMSVLTLGRSPGEILSALTSIAEDAFGAVVHRIQDAHDEFTGGKGGCLPWQVKVKTFDTLYGEIRRVLGEAFEAEFQARVDGEKARIDAGEINYMDASFELLEFCLDRCPDKDPMMILALSPPFYTPVCNDRIPDLDPRVKGLTAAVDAFAQREWNEGYAPRKYFTGICDLSYAYPLENPDDVGEIRGNMPLWGRAYDIPFSAIEAVKMPSVNIGPWGKDLHKLTERVHRRDLYERTPRIMEWVIRSILGG